MLSSSRPEKRSSSEQSPIPVATSSSGREGHGPSPSKQSTSEQSVTFEPQGTRALYYDLTSNNVTLDILPPALLLCVCDRVFVEYLYDSKVGEPPTMKTVGMEQAPNHVVIKIDFAHNVDGYFGVHILMDVNPEILSADFKEDTFARGVLYMKVLTYRGQSWNSCRTLEVELGPNRGRSLWTFMNQLLDKNMQTFSFVAMNGYYRGRRHWVANVLLIWQSVGLITPIIKGTYPVVPPIQIGDIYGALGYDYASPYQNVHYHSAPLLSGIMRGAIVRFDEYGEQVVPYVGSDRYEVALEYVNREGLTVELGWI
ncbi:hypothetical protein DL767_004718 [Monosporascus sp. MG133]|nr:hypothetical protein DL767_004718 [Monosporascus sp. MG133]